MLSRRINVLDVGLMVYNWPVFRCPSLAGFGCPPRVEQFLDRFEVRTRVIREKAGFERYAVDPELMRASNELFERKIVGRGGLLRVDLAEEAVIAITVDADFHGDVRAPVALGGWDLTRTYRDSRQVVKPSSHPPD